MVQVKQSQLPATDTLIDMENYYSDAVVSSIVDVDRSIQNRSQFVRLSLTRPQPNYAARGDSLLPSGVLTVSPHYIDGLFTPNPTTGISLMVIGFDPRLVSTTTIDIYSTLTMSTTPSKWTVSTSLTNLVSEFENPIFEAAVQGTPTQGTAGTPAGTQFKTTLTVTAPTIDTSGDGLPYWRITHADGGAFNSVTEVQILDPLSPKVSYFETDGDYTGSSHIFEQANILDACWDPNNNTNGQFYTIRFNNDLVGTSTVTLSDDFGEGDAGTASGTNNFNTARWTESGSNDRFLRLSDELSYVAGIGKGQLETTYTFAEDFDIEILVSPTTLTTENMWFAMRALDSDNKAIISEGMGLNATSSGVFFSSYIDNFVNSTTGSTLSELRVLWHNTTDGTDSFTLTSDGSAGWTVSGTQTGALTDATTGVLYSEGVDSNTPLEFIISSPTPASIGQQFIFDIVTANITKFPLAAGTIGISRSSNDLTTDNVVTVPVDLGTPVEYSVELFGNTDGTVSLTADDYVVTTGSGTFSDVSVFTIERTDDEGKLLATNPTFIESFDVIGDPSLNYNDFLDGRVQIACTSSGTDTDGFVYVKINNVLYKYANNISQSTEAGAIATSTAQIAADGTSSLQWTRESGLDFSAQPPFLTYLEFDELLKILHLRTINPATLNDTTDTREVLLDISDYDTNRYGVFYDQNDLDTLYYVDSSTNLQAFNLDDRISAFMAVNALDITLPAGTAQETTVNADVINAWGAALDGKTVSFTVTGDGAVTPSSDVTVSGGRASTTFTVGATVGVSTVTATVTET